jgi:hypothetical protein
MYPSRSLERNRETHPWSRSAPRRKLSLCEAQACDQSWSGRDDAPITSLEFERKGSSRILGGVSAHGLVLKVMAARGQGKSAQKQERRKIIAQRGHRSDRYLQRTIAASKIADHRGQKHVQQPATDMRVPTAARRTVRTRRRGQLLTAVRALTDLYQNCFSAKRAFAGFHDEPRIRPCKPYSISQLKALYRITRKRGKMACCPMCRFVTSTPHAQANL